MTQENAPGTPEPGEDRPPAPLLVAAGLVLVEGLLTLMYGISEAVHVASDRLAMGITTSVFFLVYGVGLVFCAWGLNRVRSWARGPVLLAQLIWLGLAWNFRHGDTWPIAVMLAVPALIALAGLLHPRTIDALEGRQR